MNGIMDFLSFLQAIFDFLKSFSLLGYFLFFLFAVLLFNAIGVLTVIVNIIITSVLLLINKFLISGLKLFDWLLISRLKNFQYLSDNKKLYKQHIDKLILTLLKVNVLIIKLENKNKRKVKKFFNKKIKNNISKSILIFVLTIFFFMIIFNKQFQYHYTNYFSPKVAEKCIPDENFKFPKNCKIKSV